MKEVVIKRINPPTHLDPMPYLTEWHHELEDGSIKIWIQCNKIVDDNTKPHWIRLGDLFEKCWLNKECETHWSTDEGNQGVECDIEHLVYYIWDEQ